MSELNFWNSALDKAKAYYANNKKAVTILGGGIVLVAGLVAFTTLYWFPQRQQAASEKLAKLYHYFETDSFAVVVNGIKGKRMATAPQIADDYRFTQKGREAALMAGESYMHLGKWDKALKYLDRASADDMILGPSIISAQALCNSELGKIEKAAKLYEKAADWGQNDYTAVYYKKAGYHYEKSGDFKAALRCYETIKSKYATSDVASDIEKYIYKAKGQLGELNN